jgi:hypothetical protein
MAAKGPVALRTAAGIVLATACGIGSANAQIAADRNGGCGSGGSWSHLFTGTVNGFRQIPSRQSAALLAIGGVAALGAHRLDHEVNEGIATPALRSTFRPGTVVGATPFELAAALTTYGIGRASNNGCLARLGGDLFRVQLMAEGLTFGLKQATRRSRPEGTGYSFPSGHTTVSFASATVLQQHLGWKVGLPAYAVATYVGVSRVENKRHYLSDVVFGAALGITAGRTIAVGPGRRVAVSPLAVPGGGGALFSWVEKP